MKKIPTLFLRECELEQPMGEPHDLDAALSRIVTDLVRPGCEWVLEGKGVATRMWDGLCCLVKDGRLWRQKLYQPPPGLRAAVSFKEGNSVKELRLDPVDKYHKPNLWWWPVTDAPEDQWHREAWEEWIHRNPKEAYRPELDDGTYELCGPEIKGNPEGFDNHELAKHGDNLMNPVFNGLSNWEEVKETLNSFHVMGVVWWHRDDEDLPYHERRLAKVKRSDFGLEWPLK